MSILKPLEDLIHKLDGEAKAEAEVLKQDFEAKFGQVVPVLDSLRTEIEAAVTAAAEAATPGLTGNITTAVENAIKEIKALLGAV